MSEMNTSNVLADHLVGNLYYNLSYVPLIASALDTDTMRVAVGGDAAILYSEMCRLVRSGERLTAGSLEAGLRAQRFNFDWLAKLQSRLDVESIETLHHYVAEIDNYAELLRIRQHSTEAIAAAQEPGARADVVAGDLQAKLASSKRAGDTVEGVASITAKVSASLKDIRTGKEYGASSGFRRLDKVFKLVDRELIVIAGRPSQGKTSLWRQIFFNRAMQLEKEGNGQVLLFSADDSPEKLIRDLACSIAGVDINDIRSGQATTDDWNRLEWALERIGQLPMVIDGTPKPTIEQMYYRAAMLNAQKPVRLAGMDYMSLIQVDKAHSERQEAEKAATGCKGIGNTLGFPFILLSQIRKGVEDRADKWPTPSDLLYSGEAEANVCLLVMRPEHYISRGERVDCDDLDKEGVALINVGKNKSGEIGMVRLAFEKRFARFADLSYERERIYLNN